MPMATALDELDVTTRVLKRAQYEAFAFELAADGVVVRNESHADPTDHEYLVAVTDGIPATCECPADERFEGACKHRVAVAIREPILAAATREQVAADGGIAADVDNEEPAPDDDTTDDDRPDDCTCEDLRGEFPCWPCVRDGWKELPE